MSSLALEIEDTLRHLDQPAALRLERLVREALALHCKFPGNFSFLAMLPALHSIPAP